MAPIVSVIIPTYNRAYCIKRTIDSVLNQSFKDFDIFVIDNKKEAQRIRNQFLRIKKRIMKFSMLTLQ